MGLRHMHREHRARVEQDSRHASRADRDDLRRQRAPDQAVQQYHTTQEAPASSTEATAIRAVIIVVCAPSRRPLKPFAQPLQLQRRHHRVGSHRTDHEARDAERLVERDADVMSTNHVHPARRVGIQGALKREEGAREQQG